MDDYFIDKELAYDSFSIYTWLKSSKFLKTWNNLNALNLVLLNEIEALLLVTCNFCLPDRTETHYKTG